MKSSSTKFWKKSLCILCVLCGCVLNALALDREAFSITNYDLSLQVDPETLVLAVIARTAEAPEEEEVAEAAEVPEAVADATPAREGEQAG